MHQKEDFVCNDEVHFFFFFGHYWMCLDTTYFVEIEKLFLKIL